MLVYVCSMKANIRLCFCFVSSSFPDYIHVQCCSSYWSTNIYLSIVILCSLSFFLQFSAVKHVGITTSMGHSVRSVVVMPWPDSVQYVKGCVTTGGEEMYTWSACRLTKFFFIRIYIYMYNRECN